MSSANDSLLSGMPLQPTIVGYQSDNYLNIAPHAPQPVRARGTKQVKKQLGQSASSHCRSNMSSSSSSRGISELDVSRNPSDQLNDSFGINDSFDGGRGIICESPLNNNASNVRNGYGQHTGDSSGDVKKKLLSSHKKYRSHSQPILEPFGSEKR